MLVSLGSGRKENSSSGICIRFFYNILSFMFIVKNLVKSSKAAYIFDRKCIVLQVMKWSPRRRSRYPSQKIHASLQGMERVYTV